MSTIKVTNVQNPSAASAAITLDTNGQATLNGLAYPTSGSLSGRNRIINGDMRIDQRNAGASVTPSSSAVYPVDRWIAREFTDGSATAQQSTTAPAGFNNSVVYTVTSADSSLASNQFADVQHRVEGFNVADLNWGTASAQTVTLSFWVRSSVTGTYAVAPHNESFNRSYLAEYTITSANTWEYKTITIPGDTSGTWNTGNGIGMFISWTLACGSDYIGTAGQWNAAGRLSTSSATNLLATNGATFYITGVQLEAGSVATPFEHRSYGDELQRCMRYYYSVGGTAGYQYITCTASGSASISRGAFLHPVRMRTDPAFTHTGVSTFALEGASGYHVCSDFQYVFGTSEYAHLAPVSESGGSGLLTAGQPYVFLTNNNLNARLYFNAEL